MKQKWLAALLSVAMLLPTMTGLVSCTKQETKKIPPAVTDTPENQLDGAKPLTSARAVDHGDMIYYLDSDGALWASYSDHATEIAPLSASQICIQGETLWYAAGNTLSTYHLATGETEEYTRQSGEITTFAIYGDTIYYLCEDKLYQNNHLLIDLATRTAPDGTSLSTVCDFELREDDLILLYLPNPHHQDEATTPGYLLSEHNDTYITYQYQISADTLASYDFETQQGGSYATSSEGISINGWTLPFTDYPVGSYFTQNGKACTCHDKGYCIANNKSWENCLRYWPSKSSYKVDLRGVQCMGFARFCQWRLFGSHDYNNSTDFYNAFGKKLSAGSWTANTVKETLTEVGPGGHIRTGAGHSLFVISVSSSGFVTYECNTNAKDCKIYTRQWTWASFFSYCGSRELLYYNMPRNYSGGGSVTPDEDYETGAYRVAADGGLNFRAQATTSSAILSTIPNGTILQITAIQKVGSYYWGYTTYSNKSGWVRLDFTVYQNASVSSIEITALPAKTTYTVGDSFSTAGMTVEAKFTDGTAFAIAGYTCSGYDMNKAGTYTVKVTYGSFSDTFTITVKEKIIVPTSLTLSMSQITLLVGDTFALDYILLPADTTQKTITWTTTDRYTATVNDGVIDALEPGMAVIKATTENGLTATCRVTVITMPTGTNWSTTSDGAPLSSLPFGIEAVDYSIRYRLQTENGWGEWIYGDIPSETTGYQCQFRSFTATFVNTLDGQTVDLFTVEFNQVIDLANYTLSKDGYLFTGWYTDPQGAESHDTSKASTRKITVSGDLLLYAGWIPLDLMSADNDDPFATTSSVSKFGMAGVELLPSGDATGLRFLARISTTLITEIEGLHKSNQSLQPSKATETGIGFGMVVRMRSYTVAPLLKAEDSYLYKGGAVTVPAQRTFATYKGYILFNAFVCGYTPEYYKTDFVARPYITYTDVNGLTHTYYFTATGQSSQGGGYYTSLYTEAQKMVASDSVDPVIKKWLEDNILN